MQSLLLNCFSGDKHHIFVTCRCFQTAWHNRYKSLAFCFQHFESAFLNASKFLHNDCVIVLVWCLFRFHLRAKMPQLPRNSSEAVWNYAMKLQGKFTKHLQIFSAAIYRICWWCSSGVCEWVVPCMSCVLKNDTTYVKIVSDVLYTFQ